MWMATAWWSNSRTIALVALVLAAPAGLLSCGGKEATRMSTSEVPLQSAGSGVLPDRLVCSPVLWQAGAARVIGCVTREYSGAVRGNVTLVKYFDLQGKPVAGPAIRGFEVYPGQNAATGDLDGDGRDDLVIVDANGRVQAFGVDGKALPGFPTPETNFRILTGAPVIRDINNDGKAELCYITAKDEENGLESALCIRDSRGNVFPGLPVPLPAGAVGNWVLATAGAGGHWPVFAQADGSISTFDPKSSRTARLASIPPEKASSVSLAAVDVNGDGIDEVLYTAGDSAVKAVTLGQTPKEELLYQAEGRGILAAITAGKGADGKPVICIFAPLQRQFTILAGSSRMTGLHIVPAAEKKILASLTAIQTAAGETNFLAVFFVPAGAGNVDEIFALHANDEKKADFKRYHEETVLELKPLGSLDFAQRQRMETAERNYKRSLLADQLGERQAEARLQGVMETEVLLLDAAGNPRTAAPFRIEDAAPFLDRKGRRAAAPVVVVDKTGRRTILVVGTNGLEPKPGRLSFYALP
jgi:hypothetical protein